MKPNERLTKYYYDSISDDNSAYDSWWAFRTAIDRFEWEDSYLHLYYGMIDTDTVDKIMSTYQITERSAKLKINRLQKEYINWLEARGIKL